MVVPLVVKLVNAAVPGVPLPIDPGEANVAPSRKLAFKLSTFTLLATTRGAIPVVVSVD